MNILRCSDFLNGLVKLRRIMRKPPQEQPIHTIFQLLEQPWPCTSAVKNPSRATSLLYALKLSDCRRDFDDIVNFGGLRRADGPNRLICKNNLSIIRYCRQDRLNLASALVHG